MSSKNCDAELLNDAMKVMFTHSLKSLDSIPPTQHALFQHAKRALLAAAFIWKQSLSKIPNIPKPSDWGWEWNTRTNQWVPFWTDLTDVSHACSLLLHCGCVVACKGNCKRQRGFRPNITLKRVLDFVNDLQTEKLLKQWIPSTRKHNKNAITNVYSANRS